MKLAFYFFSEHSNETTSFHHNKPKKKTGLLPCKDLMPVITSEDLVAWSSIYLTFVLPGINSSSVFLINSKSLLLQLVELLDSPLHNHFTQHDCLNYFFCFRWVLIQFKRSGSLIY